jgi:plasmid stabilization system protein ParE
MTQSYAVEYSPEAKIDLKQIYAYIAFELEEKQTARKQTDRIRKSIRSLNRMPLRYAAADWEPWKSIGIRKMSVDNYVVFYLVDHATQTVTIIRIFYGGRDIENVISIEEN